MAGTIYLIPSPLGDNSLDACVTVRLKEVVSQLDYFVVEEVRTARRFLSKVGKRGEIDSLLFNVLNEHSTDQDVSVAIQPILEGRSAGVISEAGLPAVADPGASLVALAHKKGVRVVPLVGGSSLMLALMSSGMNGQSFAFNGYLPVKPEDCRRKIKFYEQRSRQENQSQIFIETPYRNISLLESFIGSCSGGTNLSLSADITMPDEFIKTATIDEWKGLKDKIIPENFKKMPCVFVLMA